MTFANVKLIVAREIRDQMRDRRTLFVIVVLPILLYPLLGMSLFQVSQFLREQSVRVLVVGSDDSVESLPLFGIDGQFDERLFLDAKRAKLLEVEFAPSSRPKDFDPRKYARNQLQSGKCDVAIFFPADFAERLQKFPESVQFRETDSAVAQQREPSPRRIEKPARTGQPEKPAVESGAAAQPPPIPNPEIIYTTANEKSQIAFRRLSEVMQRWTEIIGENALREAGLPVVALRPFTTEQADLAGGTGLRGAAGWAKILPVMLLLWALTGAFYPAIDLCAGEKERGTLETLLSSPAERSEIVVGKLLTIMLFSILTAVLNLLSVAFTGWIVLSKLGSFGPPPPLALLWISLALLPVAALFSAVCLALAAFARSSKEGQYYLMPVLLITMPLVVLPMSPGAQLNLGYSLIPISGIVLLLKTLLEGNYLPALQYAPVVVGVTVVACLVAIRWAIDQFNSESVLFSGSERLDLKLWLKRLYRDRTPTPTVPAAVCCAVVILMLQFFVGLSVDPQKTIAGFTKAVLVPQLAVILTPVLLMTLFLASKPRETLLLKLPHWSALPVAFLAALAMHPVMTVVQRSVMELYPADPHLGRELGWLLEIIRKGDLWLLLLLVGLTPAVCEELAARGFVLSGLRRLGYKWRAIVLSAVFFGLMHLILQQSVNAFIVGLVLGYIAVQSGSIFPCMVFHFTHNSLVILSGRITPELCERRPKLYWILAPLETGGVEYRWEFIVFCGIVAALALAAFGRLSYVKTPEERLREAIARGKAKNPEAKDISVSVASMIE
ncbi:MAG: CPBP family intramembrane metalloprotease [Pirellulales bacterium]|nr:CPBP family intramembrane metalloprotease [Pirellulales bacterium]